MARDSTADADFNVDFDGPAKLIYESTLQTRPIGSTKLALAQALRKVFAAVPPENAPQPVVPDALLRDIRCEEIRTPGLGTAPDVRSLVYHPPPTGTPAPVLVYVHGGGWCVGDPEEADLLTRKICLLAGVVVVSVDHRPAPEHPYPAGLDDVVSTYRWARQLAGAELGADSTRVAVGGDSSGGNLAAAATLRLRDEDGAPPVATLLLCPGTDFRFEEYESFRRLAPNSLIYDAAFVGFARSAYAPTGSWSDPYISPMHGDLHGFGPTFIIGAGQDPVVDDNRAFAQKLTDAGNEVEMRIFEAMPHAFFCLGMCREEGEAHQSIARFLRSALAIDSTAPET